MDVITMSSVIQQGLIHRNRIFTVSVLLPDKPGELQKVAGVIAAVNGNVIKLEHNQFVSVNRSAAVELRITLEAFGTEHKQQILTGTGAGIYGIQAFLSRLPSRGALDRQCDGADHGSELFYPVSLHAS